jgi:hypothetical protein
LRRSGIESDRSAAALVDTSCALERRAGERTAELEDADRRLVQQVEARERPSARLSAEKERLVVTLRSIGDAVITTEETVARARNDRVSGEGSVREQDVDVWTVDSELEQVREAPMTRPAFRLEMSASSNRCASLQWSFEDFERYPASCREVFGLP